MNPSLRQPIVGLVLLISAFLSLHCGGAAPDGDPPAELQGVLLVTVDGLVPETLTAFGGTLETPTLKRLADDGQAWRDGWSACPMSRPGAATYLTGWAPDRHRILDDIYDRLAPEAPTLAALLSQEGFRSAAFPDSSFLGEVSGLHRGFDLVDAPPGVGLGALRYIPALRPAGEQVQHVVSWLDGLPKGERFFIWVHSSLPLLRQMGTEEEKAPPAVEEFDAALGQILAAVDAYAPSSRTFVAVAGTFGSVTGDEGQLPGVGMSLGPRAAGVPVFARFPEFANEVRPADQMVWAPDVAMTVAHLAGLTLDGSEGVALTLPVPDGRPSFSWTRAPLDELGWKGERAVRQGGRLRILGNLDTTLRLADGTTIADAAPELDALLEPRPIPVSPRIDPDRVRPLLKRAGIRLDPAPTTGRSFGTPETRAETARYVHMARTFLRRQKWQRVMKALRSVAQSDPDNKVALLDRGQMMLALGHDEKAAESLTRALELYPSEPEVLHWWIHAHWDAQWMESQPALETLLEVLPGNPDLLYDLACVRSKGDDPEGAERFLRSAIEAGYRDWGHMESDPDLRRLRESGRFADLMRDYRR